MRILQISCSYLPDKIGGTEVYLYNLSHELASRGHQVFISYIEGFYEKNGPKVRIKEYALDGISVFVIRKNIFNFKTYWLYFDTEDEISPLFRDYLGKIKPDIVHFHHFSPTDIIYQMRIAKEMNLPVILTYHTPMMTCAHADMLYLGKSPCSGKIEYKKCLICAQTRYGIPPFLGLIWASLPKGLAQSLGSFVSRANFKGPLATWLQLPWLTRERIARLRMGFEMVEHFVAVCLWVNKLLVENGIPTEKITLCRQGIGRMPENIKRQKADILRLGYLGRIDAYKGIDVLLGAFKFLPAEYKIELYIYGLWQTVSDSEYYRRLCRKTRGDRRIKWLNIPEGRDKFQVLSQLDALVIPSRWLETGPLVLLEAWAAGTPVIGANLGGIAELVTEGKAGLLFKSGDALDLSRVIARIYEERGLLEKLRAGIPSVRTMKEVADDMEKLYQGLG